MGELRLSCFGIGENALYTINAITPLLNPDISDEEARSRHRLKSTEHRSLMHNLRHFALMQKVGIFGYLASKILSETSKPSSYWRENKAWYVVNDEKDRFELTKKATPRAVESFKMYLRQNNLPDSPVPVNYGNGEAMI